MKKKTSTFEINMCEGPIFGKMMLFALPLMASSLLQLMFNAADIIVVGKFAGDNALSAVGSNGAMINLLVNFFMGLSVGANVLVARYYAAKQEEDLKETVHTAMLLSIISGFFLLVVGVVFSGQIIVWMKVPLLVKDLSLIYLRIYFLGMPAMMIYNFGAAILRAVGDTRRPLFFLLGAGVINVGLNLLFVIVFDKGVAGVALATIISQWISAVCIFLCLLLEKGAVHLEIQRLRIHPKKFLKILQIGLPASFQGILFSFSNVIIQSSVNTFGETVVAGNSAASSVEGFVYVAMNSFHQTIISFTSQNYGVGNHKRVVKSLLYAQLSVIVVGVILGNLVAHFGSSLLYLYTDEAKVVAAGQIRLDIISRTYALCGMMDVMVGCLRGLGYSIMPMIVSLVGACGLRLLWIFTLFQTSRFHAIEYLFATYPVSWTVTFVAHVVCFVIIWNYLKKRRKA